MGGATPPTCSHSGTDLMYGMDVEAADVVVALIDQSMQQVLVDAADRVHWFIAATVWHGPDAERIRSDIDTAIGESANRLLEEVVVLRELIETTARSQRSASGASTRW